MLWAEGLICDTRAMINNGLSYLLSIRKRDRRESALHGMRAILSEAQTPHTMHTPVTSAGSRHPQSQRPPETMKGVAQTVLQGAAVRAARERRIDRVRRGAHDRQGLGWARRGCIECAYLAE